MLLDLLLGKSNPVAQFADTHSNVLSAIGAGLAQGPTFSQGLANGAGNIAQAKALDQQQAQLRQSQNATLGFLQKYPDLLDMAKQGNIQGAWQLALQREANANKTYALSPGETLYQGGKALFTAPAASADDLSKTPAGRQSLADQYGLSGVDRQTYILTGKLPGGNQSVRAGVGQPIYGRNKKTGAYVPFEPMTNGTAVNLVDPSDSASNYDFDPYYASAQRTGGTVDAKTAAAARAALPSAQQALTITDKAVNSLLSDTKGQEEQFGNILGIPQQMLPAFPGTAKANFQNDLAQGMGQAFLQARQMLKGGGQITDYEGAKAEAAFSRMQLAAQKGDRQAFNQAVLDFQQAVHQGYAKLAETAAGQYAAGPVPALATPPAANGTSGQTATGIQWSVSP